MNAIEFFEEEILFVTLCGLSNSMGRRPRGHKTLRLIILLGPDGTEKYRYHLDANGKLTQNLPAEPSNGTMISNPQPIVIQEPVKPVVPVVAPIKEPKPIRSNSVKTTLQQNPLPLPQGLRSPIDIHTEINFSTSGWLSQNPLYSSKGFCAF